MSKRTRIYIGMLGMFCIGAIFQWGMQMVSFELGLVTIFAALIGAGVVGVIGCMLGYQKMLDEEDAEDAARGLPDSQKT